MNINQQSLWTKLLVMLLGLLGFACGDKEKELDVPEKDWDDMVCLYGCPSASFKVVGTVTDQENNPIENASVVVYANMLDTVYTAADGSFTLNEENFGDPNVPIVTFKDGYSRDSTIIRMDYQDGDGYWYLGHSDATHDPVLTKLQEPEENQNSENNKQN